MRSFTFLFKRIISRLDKKIYIKQTPYSFKKILLYFLLLLILLAISLFIDTAISIVIVVIAVVSKLYFYFLLKSNGLFIELERFFLDGKTHTVVEHITIDDIFSSARLSFFEKESGVYWLHSKLSLFPEKKCVHFSVIQDILKSKRTAVSVLMLGGGTESVSSMIASLDTVVKVDSVELSTEMQRIGKKYFISVLSKNKQIKINQIHADAENFIKNNKQKYDFIFIDLFSDSFLPEFIFSSRFLKKLSNSQTNGGEVFINFADYESTAKSNCDAFRKYYKDFSLYKYNSSYFTHIIGYSNGKKHLNNYSKLK